jgi:hypothetical protein
VTCQGSSGRSLLNDDPRRPFYIDPMKMRITSKRFLNFPEADGNDRPQRAHLALAAGITMTSRRFAPRAEVAYHQVGGYNG